MEKQLVLILDFGSLNNQLAAKKIRECNVYCEVFTKNLGAEQIKEKNPQLIVVTGENFSAFDSSTAKLGIKTVSPIKEISEKYALEYTPLLFEGTVEEVKKYLISENFRCDWTMEDYAEMQIKELRKKIGDGKVLLALSGGVDSSVCASLLSKAVGKQLTCIFVDHGLMRKNEPEEIDAVFGTGEFNYIHVDASARFLNLLKGVENPETKRKIIGTEFIRVFEEEAKKLGKVDYLAQGTIYPDIIESGADGKKAVKSHHNVGGLPDYIDFKELVEPLKYLFKDEVRKLGTTLGLPEALVMRQPFPGPGLAVRVIGEITKEKLDTLRDADFIYREEIAKAGLAGSINQYFAVLTSMKSVGVRKEERTYEYTLALRAVITTDFMNAEWARIPYDVLETVSSRIVSEVAGINRVVYDITSKPPSTIEWE